MNHRGGSRITWTAAAILVIVGSAAPLRALATASTSETTRPGATDIRSAGYAGVAALSAQANDSAAVVAVVDRYHRALASGDTAVVLRLLAPDAIVLESGGAETRAEYLGHHLPADIGFARAVERERGPVSVRVSGNTAWATSSSTTVGEYRGRSINSQGAELMVLTREGEEWRIQAIHWSSRERGP